jgi:Holliday junction resolvase RusA-like endonuclease
VTGLTFIIPGIPQQQGSKTHRNGYSFEANKKLKPWRNDALDRALAARPDRSAPTFMRPVTVTMVAYFPRPANHYGTGKNAGKLKPTAPYWHASAPDLDKLQRALGDVLTQSQVILDDRLIVSWNATKLYGEPRLEVTVRPVPEVAA